MSCPFCQDSNRLIDYKDVELLAQFLDELGKIRPRHDTHLCNEHQKILTHAINRARQLALLPR